jgi:replicative DNA helicase
VAENNEVDITIINLEKVILYYFLKDKSYIEDVFDTRGIDLDYFTVSILKKTANIIKEYYKNYNSLIVEREFFALIDEAYNSKKIEQAEHAALLDLYEDLKDEDKYNYDDQQYERFLYSWLDAETALKAQDIIKQNLDSLKSYQGIEATKNLSNSLEKVSTVINTKKGGGFNVIDIVNDIDEQIDDLKSRRENPDKNRGIPSGIDALDAIFNGFEGGTLTLFGGITGSGKTTLAMNISRNQFELYNKNVLIFSLEMGTKQWARKYNAIDFRVDAKSLVRGDRSKINDDKFEELCERIKTRKEREKEGCYNVISIPAQTQTWPQMISTMNKTYPDKKFDIIFIDQLSLINLGKYSGLKLNDALGFLTKDIRSYSQLNNIPIVLLVQANRSSITRTKDGKRVISIDVENVEDSNKVIADADNFIAINPVDGDLKCLLNVIKQREGPKGSIDLKANQDIGVIYDENSEYFRNFLNHGMSEEELAEFETDTKLNELDMLEPEDRVATDTQLLASEDLLDIDDLLGDDNLLNDLTEEDVKDLEAESKLEERPNDFSYIKSTKFISDYED